MGDTDRDSCEDVSRGSVIFALMPQLTCSTCDTRLVLTAPLPLPGEGRSCPSCGQVVHAIYSAEVLEQLRQSGMFADEDEAEAATVMAFGLGLHLDDPDALTVVENIDPELLELTYIEPAESLGVDPFSLGEAEPASRPSPPPTPAPAAPAAFVPKRSAFVGKLSPTLGTPVAPKGVGPSPAAKPFAPPIASRPAAPKPFAPRVAVPRHAPEPVSGEEASVDDVSVEVPVVAPVTWSLADRPAWVDVVLGVVAMVVGAVVMWWLG